MAQSYTEPHIPIIATAEVIDSVDPTDSGVFMARIPAYGNELEAVYYTSPYGSTGQGAFIAIPETGTKILVCKPIGSESWYYLGSTFSPEPQESTGPGIKDNVNLKPIQRADPRLNRARGFPMRMQWTGPGGGGLKILGEYNPGFFNDKVELHSTINKRVVLTDSPAQDCIIIDSGNGSKITVSDDPQNNIIPSRAVRVETVGPTQLFNIQSQTDILVVDGQELQLLNNSTGSQAPPGEPDKAGNVNIQSKWKDVNVFTQAEQGRIFIECLNNNGSNQVIEIQTNGEGGAIRIKTNGKVDIEAENIGINATNNIDINAGGSIRMQSGGQMSLKGSTVDADADGDINLNSGSSSDAVPEIGNSESYYENEGITTY